MAKRVFMTVATIDDDRKLQVRFVETRPEPLKRALKALHSYYVGELAKGTNKQEPRKDSTS